MFPGSAAAQTKPTWPRSDVPENAYLRWPPPANEKTLKSVNIHVKETAGIRRSGYPVNVRIPFAKGSLPDATHARLLSNETEVPAQYAAESGWQDGSVQWLAVDFNTNIGPTEEQTYRLEYGEDVKAALQPRGLTLNETAEAVQVGNMRFSKTGVPLLLSANYRQEAMSSGRNGIAITDADGTLHDLTGVESLNVEIVKRGPLYVVLRYSGRMLVSTNYSVPFAITIEMPNSKSWCKVTATVQDPGKRLRELSFDTPFAFGSFPWVWDFGTYSWTYGSVRNRTDSVVLTQVVGAPGTTGWQIRTGAKGQEQLQETAGGNRSNVVEGWGHIQDAKEAVAFAIDQFGRQAGTYTIALDGEGRASFRVAPAQPGLQHQLTVYEHFVATPVPIGAVTSPVSMLNPLVAVCDREQYTTSGVQPPSDAVTPKKLRQKRFSRLSRK